MIRSPGRAVFHVVIGSGDRTPFLTMHGGMGLDHSYLRPWFDAFGADRPVVFYDHFGNGRSQIDGDASGAANLESLTADAESLRSKLGFEKVVLYGHSFGGCVAIEYALAHPERVAALILDSAVASADLGDAMVAHLQKTASPEQMAVLLKAFTGGIQTDEEYAQGWQEILPLYFCRYDERRSDTLHAVQFSARAFNQFAIEGLSQFRPDLSKLRVPTLILTGRHDHVVPSTFGGPALHAQIPGSTLHVFENSGHFPFIEDHAEYVTVVNRWLSANGSKPPRA